MGAAKRRREAFFEAHPFCCFCGGHTLANTIDHVPLRAAFANGIGPEGFEFPACEACNGGSSQSEQILALYARLCDRNNENYSWGHIEKLIVGVRNNRPHLLPKADVTANAKRRVLKRYGWELPKGHLLDDIGLVAVPKGIDADMALNATKLLAALKYRHLNDFLTGEHGVFWGWSQQGLPGVKEAQDILLKAMPELVIGNRVNTSIGDQFAYRWGINPNEGLFAYAAGFGAGLFLFAGSAHWAKVEGMENWTRFSEWTIASGGQV